MASSTETPMSLRPEAQPFTWKDLTKDQREALLQLHRLLDAFIKHFPNEPSGSPEKRLPLDQLPLVDIDRERVSNIFLIDGGRGSGKTSLLVTVLEFWRRALRQKEGESRLLQEGKDDSEAKRLAGYFTPSGSLAGRLVPLRILELQPLPDGTTLLVWLASRLNELVRALGRKEASAGKSPSPWLTETAQELESHKTWRKFLHAAALGSDGHLGSRRGQLDPEAFVEELEETELARIDITKHWRDFLAALTNDLAAYDPQRLRAELRLVIPIDDADMNPRRCRELLDLLRTLWDPRVIFVLTGDFRLFHKVLQAEFAEALTQRLRGLNPPQEWAFKYWAAEPQPSELATAMLDKLLPGPHRLRLDELAPDARFNIVAPLLEVGAATLPHKLNYYFETYKAQERSPLPGRLRSLREVQQRLENAPANAIDRFVAIWQEEALRQDGSVRGLFTLTHDGHLRLSGDIRVDEHNMHLVTVGTKQMPLILGTVERRNTNLDGSLDALALVGIDILGDQGTTPPFMRANIAQRSLYASAAASVLLNGTPLNDVSVGFSWPLPAWPSEVDRVFFYSSWKKWVQRVLPRLQATEALPQTAEWLADTFVWLAAEVTYKRGIHEPSREPQIDWAKRWKKLVNGNRKAAKTRRQEAFHRWLYSEIILLAAPESGLPAEVANRIFETWKEATEAQELVEAAACRRRRIAGRLNISEEQAEERLEKFDQQHGDFHWSQRRSGAAEAVRHDLLTALSRVRVTPGLGNLGEYVTRLDLIDQLLQGDRNWQSFALECLRKYPINTSGVARVVLRELWLEATKRTPTLDPVRADDGLTQIETFGLAPSNVPHSFFVPVSEHLRWVERWSLVLMQNFEVGSLAGLSPQLSALLALAHDVLVDEQDHSDNGAFGEFGARDMPMFPLVWVSILYYGDDLRIPWPLPRWQTLWRRKDLFTALRGIFAQVKQFLGSGYAETMNRAVDGLIFSVLETLQQVQGRQLERPSVPPFNLNLSVAEWRGIANRLVISLSDVNDRRYQERAYRYWVEEECALLAAPESGMSAQAASIFLAELLRLLVDRHQGLMTMRGQADQADLQARREQEGLLPNPTPEGFKQRWREARRRRLEKTIADAGRGIQADNMLLWIRRKDPDHPWYRIVDDFTDTSPPPETSTV